MRAGVGLVWASFGLRNGLVSRQLTGGFGLTLVGFGLA